MKFDMRQKESEYTVSAHNLSIDIARDKQQGQKKGLHRIEKQDFCTPRGGNSGVI
jgi:hypothetical protein